MNLFEIIRNCSLSPIIFLNGFSVVFSRTIGWKDLGESYDTLLGLGMIIVVNVLKWDGQYPKSMQMLANVSNVNELDNTFVIFNNSLDMTSR